MTRSIALTAHALGHSFTGQTGTVKHGVALVALGFVDFIYADPLPREK